MSASQELNEVWRATFQFKPPETGLNPVPVPASLLPEDYPADLTTAYLANTTPIPDLEFMAMQVAMLTGGLATALERIAALEKTIQRRWLVDNGYR